VQTAFIVSFGRWILPIIAFYIIVGCGVSLVRGNRKVGTIGYLINSANGDEIPLTSYETSIGRSNSCDIVLSYTTVSRFHAVIAKRGGKWMIFDTYSKTGTFINGQQIHGKGFIEDGDTLVFGNAVFRFTEHKAKNEHPEDVPLSTSPLFVGDEKFYTGEILIPQKIKKGCLIENCITGEQMEIDDMDSILIGRSNDAHIHISIQAASRNHALISRSDSGWIIEDLDSAAGTLLNGEPVTECTPLKDGDIIEICGFTVKFVENN